MEVMLGILALCMGEAGAGVYSQSMQIPVLSSTVPEIEQSSTIYR